MSGPDSAIEPLGERVNSKEVLFIFTRYPVPGTTKTRLIPALGAKGAAQLQCQMTERTLGQARNLNKRQAIQTVIAYAGEDEKHMRSWLGDELVYMPQGSGSIGDRMYHAFVEASRLGLSKAVIIGTDIPQLTADMIWRAFQFLEESELVLGPAVDGGYYLIGMGRLLASEPPRNLFNGVDWGTARVLEQTLFRAQIAGYSCILLDELQDVDRPEDLTLWNSLTQNSE